MVIKREIEIDNFEKQLILKKWLYKIIHIIKQTTFLCSCLVIQGFFIGIKKWFNVVFRFKNNTIPSIPVAYLMWIAKCIYNLKYIYKLSLSVLIFDMKTNKKSSITLQLLKK